MTEIQLQSKCFQKFWNTYPQLRRCLFHVPNGGSRNKIEAAHLKTAGTIPGIPDMLLLINSKCYALEFKTPQGYLSSDQKITHKALQSQNIPIFIIRSEQQFWITIQHIFQQNSQWLQFCNINTQIPEPSPA